MNAIETVTCGRCGGSGKFSFNTLDGDRCYGCHGSGKKYTKRGAVTVAYLNSLRMVPVSSLHRGDTMRVVTLSGSKFYRVLSVQIGLAKEQGCYSGDGQYLQARVDCEGITVYERSDAMVRKGYGEEQKREQLRQALAYQATLTKAGTPRKRP